MLQRKRSLAAALFACSALIGAGMAIAPAVAQQNPTMTNVIPDGGTGSMNGTVKTIDPSARTMTITSKSGDPVNFVVAPSVRVDNVNVGDDVDAQYERTVVFLITGPNVAPPAQSQTVGQFAHTPGGIPAEGLQLAGTVTKIDSGNSFDVVNPGGGGIYTIKVTDPQKVAMLSHMKVGDTVAVNVSPLTITAITKCGFFGCG